ncbi:MAG: hypothetical protein ABFD84_04435 [Candidatus Polarisedimenticolia bacterium]|nr:hypothetical protein [bacterium]
MRAPKSPNAGAAAAVQRLLGRRLKIGCGDLRVGGLLVATRSDHSSAISSGVFMTSVSNRKPESRRKKVDGFWGEGYSRNEVRAQV